MSVDNKGVDIPKRLTAFFRAEFFVSLIGSAMIMLSISYSLWSSLELLNYSHMGYKVAGGGIAIGLLISIAMCRVSSRADRAMVAAIEVQRSQSGQHLEDSLVEQVALEVELNKLERDIKND